MEVKEISVRKETSLEDALKRMDTTALGALFVVDQSDKLIGLFTDGDVRRALLNGKKMNNNVTKIMNVDFVALSIDAENDEILKELNDKHKIIPIVDKEGKLIDYATINRLRRIPIASPQLAGNELNYVAECVKTSWVSSQGKFVIEFENLFADYHRGRTALAVSNGTVALHLALVALGIGKGDEVIVPDLTFAASINAILYTDATPVLVDVDRDSWNIDIKKTKLKITDKTKAIMPVHLYGQPCEMDSVVSLADKYDLFIIEDCAEALGSFYEGQPVGTFGDAATFSFFGNKTITTGEGGMVVFKDHKVAERADVLRNHGMNKSKRYWHEEIGYNYRLTNLQAALGVAQFERLDKLVDTKREIAKRYHDILSSNPYFQLPIESEKGLNSFWLYTFLIKAEAPFSRDNLMQRLSYSGIETRPVFYPLHEMPPYRAFGDKSDLEISSSVSQSGISLPSFPNLSLLEVDYICKMIAKY